MKSTRVFREFSTVFHNFSHSNPKISSLCSTVFVKSWRNKNLDGKLALSLFRNFPLRQFFTKTVFWITEVWIMEGCAPIICLLRRMTCPVPGGRMEQKQ